MAFAALTFALILPGILGTYWLFVVRLETAEERQLRRRLRGTRPVKRVAATIVKAPETLSTLGPLAALLRRQRRAVGSLQRLITTSGMHVTIGALLLMSVLVALVVFAVVSRVTYSLSIGLLAGAAASTLPLLVVRYRAQRRMALFEEQFPDAIDLLARALRAGHAVTTALQMAGEELPDPVGAEFKRLFEEQNFGMSLPDAFRAFAERVQLLDARFFATAVLTQRETGGNLSEVFDNLSAVIRERFKVKRQVRVLSAHGRITGLVLAILPIAVAGILLFISPAHIHLLVEDPIGIDMIWIGVVLQIVGVLAIRRIVNVEY